MNYGYAAAFVQALTGDASTIIDVRMIHDTNKQVQAINRRGRLAELWNDICAVNAQGYGIFMTINQMDGQGRTNANVVATRAHYVDLDNLATVGQMYQAASAWAIPPAFAVTSSAGKAHLYWPVLPYLGLERFSTIQHKLRIKFDGDKKVADAAHVMRMPGTMHCKGVPQLVGCHAIGSPAQNDAAMLEILLADIQVADVWEGVRSPLGEIRHQAPTLQMATDALFAVDPNNLDRGEWISITAAFKQAAWNWATPEQLYDIWSNWCARYAANDVGENWKQWNDIRQTQVGWGSLQKRDTNFHASLVMRPGGSPLAYYNAVPDMPAPPSGPVPRPGDMLNAAEQASLFAGCFFIERFGSILVPGKRLLNQTQFNGRYGGYAFMINETGAPTDDAWKAATRSRLGTIPKVDHLRFLPHEAPNAIVQDDIGRLGVNTYIPARIERRAGDVSPFIKHMELIIPDANDRRIYLDYMAHNAKFPGHKIPWAPMIQSEEGAGKGVIKYIFSHIMGASYTYFPNAQQLVNSGSKFNAWMREKLFILVDEIKVDERRDLIEVLKPMLTEAEIEIEGKGKDQDKEDNYSNWAFFSNYKDAIPIRVNGRRFSIFYSAIQSARDLQTRAMDQSYFDKLYQWLKLGGGKEAVADWFARYPIERGQIPMRAPDTTSTASAIEQSRSPLEALIMECVADNKPGFRGGYASSIALKNAASNAGITIRSAAAVRKALEAAGYHAIGRANREYGQEKMGERATIYGSTPEMNVEWFGKMQGYE